MSQDIDIDAFRKGYYAKMEGQEKTAVEQNLERLAGMAAYSPADAQPATETEALPHDEVADSVPWDAVTDMGDIEPPDLGGDSAGEPGMAIPAEKVADVFAEWKTPIEARADFEMESLPRTLHALHNSLNTTPFELKDLADRSGLTYSVVDADTGFARKKIASDRHAEVMQGFMENIHQTPATASFLRQLDSVEQLALTSDMALAALEKDLAASERGFFESGYIGAAFNAWEYGMMARELGNLGVKWMDGSITDEERRRLDVLQKTLGYGEQQRKNQALLERMVRGTVESVGVPLYGGLQGAVEFLGRYGKEGLAAGAMAGAALGSAAGGVGAVPGAIAGGLTGLSAVAQTGFVNDMMRQEGAQTFLTLMDKGVPEELARVLAIGAGAAKGALEYVGLRQVGKVFPGVERFLTPEAASAALSAIKKNPSLAAAVGEGALAFLRGITGETATEVMQEGVDIAAEEAGRRLSGINEAAPTAGEIVGRLADTMVRTVESTALIAGAGGISRGAYQHRRAKKLEGALGDLQETQGKTLDTVADAVQNSPVMKDMPGTGEALLDHLAEQGVLPKQVFIRPEAFQQTFFQTENPDLMAAAADMGVTPESLQENLTLGTDVAVDFAKASAHILKDAERYAALKPDMRLAPDMLTDAEVEDLTAMNADAQARLDYLNDILGPLSEEVDAAESRYQQRMEIAEPYMEQWRAAGYSENQAEAFGLVLAASAERMAPLFGKTPQEYLEERLAGYFGMTQEEFENLHEGGLDAMFENRETAALLQEMGVRRGMSHTARRRALQPEFAYVYGKVSPESVQNLYGMARYKELRRQFGPGFFAKKGEGIHIDVLAHSFMSEERGGYDQNRDAVDVDEFAEKVFMPHDEFEGGIGSLLRGQAFYQMRTYPNNGAEIGAVSPLIARALHLQKPGAIVLDDVGLEHIEKRHGKEIRQLGFESAREFVSFVLENLDAVYDVDGKGRKYDFVSRAMKPQGRVMIRLEFAEEGDFYKVMTAGPLRKNQYSKKTPLWEGAHSTLFQKENPLASRRASQRGQSGVNEEITPDNRTVNHVGPSDALKEKTPLWERAQSSHSVSGTPDAISGQSGIEKNITSRKSAGKDNILHQNEKPVEVTSAALGVPEGSTIREYKKAAKKYHDRLIYESEHGKPVIQPELDKPVRFSHKGWGKNAYGGANKRKWQMFPYLREIIETSRLIVSQDIPEGTKGGFVRSHWLENDVILDGKPFQVGMTLLEDADGNLFYNLNADLEAWRKKNSGPSNLPGNSNPGESGPLNQDVFTSDRATIGDVRENVNAEEKSPPQLETLHQSRGHEELFQDGNPSVENNVTPDPDGVNLHIFASRPTGRAQGAIRPMEDGRYVVGLFKSRNASTVLHETAHFWLEELRRASELPTAPEWVREAWAKLEKAYGFERAALTPEKWREVQERFAREFEAYARDGKAPSWELQTAFSRFRNWLSEIYRSIKAILGVHEVSPEVREVFDALLATEEEIEQSRRAVARGSVMEKLGDEVAPELRDKYARAVQKAHENASAIIANRRLVDRRKAERDFREKATSAIDASETYRLIARLREEGIPFDALKGAIAEDLVYRLREKWRRARGEGRALIRKGGTLDILDVAAQFNEDTAQGLASALLDTPTRREAIDAQVEAELAEWDAAYDAEVEYSSAYDEVLALEMEALTGERQVSPAALRRQMDERTDARKMSQVDAEYRALKARLRSEERSTRRAAREARQETNAAWRERMAELKEKERLRRAALGSAYRARMERDAIVRQLRKIGDSKSVPYDYMCQIRRILGRFDGLGTPGQRLDPATLRSGLPSLQEFLAARMTGPMGEEATAAEWLLGDKAGRFSELSLEEMRDVKRLVTELAHAGRSEGQMLADAEKRSIRETGEACAESMGKLSQREFISERAGLLDTVRGAVRKGLSSITSMRFLARWMDGFEQGGVNQKAWFMPLQQALTEELGLKREMEQLLRAAVTPLLKVGKLTAAFAIEGVPLKEDVARLWKGLFDMDKVYSVALNMGNAGNLKALMAGYGWSEADLARITGRLTAEEWQAIQAVWDAIDTLYPRLDETYRKLKGVPLPKVKAQAFTVITADGQRLRLKGGYYPLIFDQRLSGKAAENQSVDEMLNGTEAVLRTPNPKSGMTNARKGGTLPPKLSMTVIDCHVADTIHYITHALPLRDAMRLFRDPAFKAAFVNAAGQENYDQLLPWLRGIARPDGEQLRGVMKAMEWMAKRGTLFAMGMNMKSALLQLTSIGNSWSEVGTGNFMRAAATLLSGPRQSWQTIRRKSAYMESRAQFMDESLRREYAEMRANGVGGVRFRNARYTLGMVQKAQFAIISALDTAVAAPTWLAAYDAAIGRGVEESAAVAEADAAVVAAQGGGGALDTPAVMRQAGIMRILCPFMSFALSDFNRKLETVRGLREYQKTGNSAISYGRAFSDFALQWVMPVVLSCLMMGLGRDDEWPDAEDYGWEALTFFTMGIPLVRDMARMAQDQFSSSGFNGARTPLLFTGVENLYRGAKHAKQALMDDKANAGYLALKETINAAGFFLGIGTPQIWRTVEGSEAYFVDDEGGVLAPLLGKPGKK